MNKGATCAMLIRTSALVSFAFVLALTPVLATSTIAGNCLQNLRFQDGTKEQLAIEEHLKPGDFGSQEMRLPSKSLHFRCAQIGMWRGVTKENPRSGLRLRNNEAAGQFQRNPLGGSSFARPLCCSLVTDRCGYAPRSRLAGAQRPSRREYRELAVSTLASSSKRLRT